MTGLEAISAHNGWAIAALGISIVFTGLTLLSLIISQIHKVLSFWDERDTHYQRIKGVWQKKEKDVGIPDIRLPQDVEESARQFRLLTERMGEPFSLPKLLELSEKCGLSRPHSTINDLVLTKHIIPDGTGYFYWKNKE